MRGAEFELATAENYRRFARSEVAGKSPLYAALCEGVAGDPELLAFLERMPPRKRQPNLLPDRYAYDYGGHRVGEAAVVFPCRPEGSVPLPAAVPRVAWRAGIDLAPVDLADPEAVAWLEALVWPEEADRLERLRAAVAIARRDPPRIVSGDLVDGRRVAMCDSHGRWVRWA